MSGSFCVTSTLVDGSIGRYCSWIVSPFTSKYVPCAVSFSLNVFGPVPAPGSKHRLKYSLFYGWPGRRLVGYDNERGKGGHRHVQGKEETYGFSTPEQLIEDLPADVRHARGES